MATPSAALKKLATELPSFERSSIEDQARAALGIVIRRALAEDDALSPFDDDPNRCPNCGKFASSIRSPYCGTDCREIAGFIRQVRSGLREGSINDADRQVALGQVIWRILGGGLPLRNSLIDAKAKTRLFKKFEDRCASCGAPATTIDHLGSHCNRTSNLQPMCDDCAETKPFGSPIVLQRPQVQALLQEMAIRIGSEEPLRACDDAETWNWRAYVAARR